MGALRGPRRGAEALAAIDEILVVLRRRPPGERFAYALKERGLILRHLERPAEARAAFEEAWTHEAAARHRRRRTAADDQP